MNRLILAGILFLVTPCFGQKRVGAPGQVESLYEEAKTFSRSGDQKRAISLLKKVISIDQTFYMAYFGLADIYHEMAQNDAEQQALTEGLRYGGDRYPSGFKFLGELLYNNGQYKEALKNMEQYLRLKGRLSEQENRLLESCRFSVEATGHPVAFNPENAGDSINTPEDEYWPGLNGEANRLIFTRLLVHDQMGGKAAYPQEDFYVSKKEGSGWQKATPLGPPVNTTENEGAHCISADGQLLFFTGCGRPDGSGSCDIYMSVRQKGVWSEPVNLGQPVNTGAWESQPSVSADGHWLYFVSNRAGGKGKMDIWRAEKLGVSPQGLPVYGKVMNADGVNSPGNELSPFIHADGRTLYFSSDYWPGLGKNDIFFFRLDSTKATKPVNLGYPINTEGNEDGFVVEVSGEKGWYTMNTKGGGRDIYWFSLPDCIKPFPVSWVKGRILNRKSREVIPADLLLKDLTTNKLIRHIYPFENEGEFLFCLSSGQNYGINISRDGYLFHSENFNLSEVFDLQKPKYLEVLLDPIEPGKTTVLKNVFFDIDSFRLKPESKGELDGIIDFLKSNPGLIVEIGGHTDNLGSEKHNLTLSGNRAAAVVEYLINNGIPSSRLRSKGYGYTFPVADNSTEEGRAQNRRTEFKILENQVKR